MIIEAIATGKTLSEAQEKAVAQLGNVNLDNVEFEVISMPKAKNNKTTFIHLFMLLGICGISRSSRIHLESRFLSLE